MSPRLSRDTRPALAALAAIVVHAPALAATLPPQVDFDREIRPILAAKCLACHGPDAEARKAGLRLDTFEGATAPLKGGNHAVVPGDPDASTMVGRVASADAGRRMPPDGHDPLTPDEIVKVRAWIEGGARYEAPWAFRPMAEPAVPEVRDAAWPRADLDRFVLETREVRGLPAPADIEPAALLRRASFDLRGLPPSEAEVRAFLANPSDAAFASFVDAVLADPAFGERWGRHWLDLARYAETLGHEFDYEIPGAWRYRDYVIEAINADISPARIVAEQIAGDMLDPRPGLGLPNVAPIATAWWFLGPATHAPVDVRQDEADRIAGQIDVVGRSLFGLSIACARCHDHKFDPIPASDYYALAGVARNTRRVEGFIDTAQDAPSLLAEARRAAAAVAESCVSSPRPEAAGADARGNVGQDARTNADATRIALGAVSGRMYEPRKSDKAVLNAAVPGERFVVLDSVEREGARWSRSGPAFGITNPDARARVALDVRGKPRIAELGTVDSATLDERLVGSARSPAFDLEARYIHVRLRGEASWIRLMIDNYWLDEANGLLFEGMRRRLGDDDPASEPNDPRDFPWRIETFDVARFKGERAYVELIDDGAGWIEVDAILASSDPSPPSEEEWSNGLDSDGIGEAVADASAALEALGGAGEVRSLVAARDALVALPAPIRAIIAEDSGAFDEPLHVRGSARNLGAPVRRARLSMLAERHAGADAGSGRLDLVRALTAPETPYLWRTLANRVWLKLFGRGIVDTPDDFGQLGASPWSAGLLDHLALKLARGASLKSMVREIVLSRAYRAAADAREVPEGAWHAMSVRRVDAESIRDAMLAASGRLDPQRGGPGVPVHLTEHMQGRGRPGQSGPVDGAGRRSIYLAIRRNFLDPFLQTFDQPQPATACGKRHASNVPAQSLAFLNSELVHELARFWGVRLADDAHDDRARIASMWCAAYGRLPEASEVEAAVGFLADERAAARIEGAGSGAATTAGGDTVTSVANGLPSDAAAVERAAFAALAHVLFASKEFIYLR